MEARQESIDGFQTPPPKICLEILIAREDFKATKERTEQFDFNLLKFFADHVRT